MENNNKENKKYKTIGEVAKKLNLIDKKTGRLQTHTIRYWETQFKQIKPTIMAGRRRYYTNKNIKMLFYIKSLLKEKGLTINGVKKILGAINRDLLTPMQILVYTILSINLEKLLRIN